MQGRGCDMDQWSSEDERGGSRPGASHLLEPGALISGPGGGAERSERTRRGVQFWGPQKPPFKSKRAQGRKMGKGARTVLEPDHNLNTICRKDPKEGRFVLNSEKPSGTWQGLEHEVSCVCGPCVRGRSVSPKASQGYTVVLQGTPCLS